MTRSTHETRTPCSLSLLGLALGLCQRFQHPGTHDGVLHPQHTSPMVETDPTACSAATHGGYNLFRHPGLKSWDTGPREAGMGFQRRAFLLLSYSARRILALGRKPTRLVRRC
ncbi:hypothetical protein BO78DRAFT_38669 [Aspergillus sclerotiicarbonarius CBS 121057]|uniref:Secreted protein n=1 Tax=Aspergillus sclerotiicarbonarius (strain CBS 121057 / IBT 28362) TaxID=1448318 RepID=A0A319ER77_ASPSB|nr:hypothetical protein BO78DRAFT_38669 [Aspergillus sclerotiicarbonarius CBS 121057]